MYKDKDRSGFFREPKEGSQGGSQEDFKGKLKNSPVQCPNQTSNFLI